MLSTQHCWSRCAVWTGAPAVISLTFNDNISKADPLTNTVHVQVEYFNDCALFKCQMLMKSKAPSQSFIFFFFPPLNQTSISDTFFPSLWKGPGGKCESICFNRITLQHEHVQQAPCKQIFQKELGSLEQVCVHKPPCVQENEWVYFFHFNLFHQVLQRLCTFVLFKVKVKTVYTICHL